MRSHLEIVRQRPHQGSKQLGWLTPAGWGLVCALKREIDKVEKRIAPFERAVLQSKHGAELKRHRKELASARETYGAERDSSVLLRPLPSLHQSAIISR